MSTTLHSRLKAKVEEMLAIARAASLEWDRIGVATAGDPPFVVGDRVVAHIAAHDPAWAIRQHEAALRVLAEHHFVECSNERCGDGGWCAGCDSDGSAPCNVHPWPCPAVRTLAELYGVPVDTEEESDAV